MTNKDRIEIGDKFVIEKPTSFEKEVVFEQLTKRFEIIISSEYLLRAYIKTNKSADKIYEFFDKAIIEFEKAIILFRLFKKEFIGFNFIVEPLDNKSIYGFSAVNFSYLIIDRKTEMVKYVIDNGEIELLNNFFREYDIFSTSEFDLAVSNFNRSYSQHFLTNIFLDTMFVLENLFLRNTSQELKYKLSMRMAYLLGGNDDTKREGIFTFIKDCYDIRSQIVHGSKIPMLDKQRIFKLGELTKDSLKIFFKKRELCLGENLDDIILKGKL
ncbi:MAG: hypothetical protein ACTSW3_09985 [Promethearchaeota archaeon]